MKELVLDLSHWDGNIDLQAWKTKHNLWGVILKAGGNETNLGRYYDSTFEQNYNKAKAANLHIGAYYYTVTTDTNNSKKDAEHFASLLNGKSFDLPVYMDVEDPAQFRLSKRTLTDVIKVFCDTLNSKGYCGGMYTGGSAWLNNMYAEELRKYAIWIAWWRKNWPTEAGDIGMWQQGGIRYSDGNIVYDDVSGYHDCNWCAIDYPSRLKNGNSTSSNSNTSVKTKISIADIAAKIHYDMVTDERNGYSQSPHRWGGDYGGTKTLSINGRNYTYKLGSYDCSSSVITAWRLALQGTPYEGKLNNATYTGDMKNAFVNSGLFTASLTPAKRGDLYLAEQKHTAMCQDGGSDGVFGYDALTEFNRNENHSATNGKPGDQDGYESIIRAYYNDGWNTVLHYNEKADYEIEESKPAITTPSVAQIESEPKNNNGLKYQVHVQDEGWLKEVRDGQQAGIPGKRFEALRFTNIPEGWKLTARAHIQNIGWRNYGVIDTNTVIGTTGKASAIECIILGVDQRSDNKKLYFSVYQANKGWKGMTPEDFSSGTDGMAIQLEGIKVWLA